MHAQVCDVCIDEANLQLVSIDTASVLRVWCVRRFVVVQVIEAPEKHLHPNPNPNPYP